jgi:hypothetical protein
MKRVLERLDPSSARLAFGGALLAAYAAFAAGAPGPPFVRLAVAVLALSFWPGAMLLRFFLVDREIEAPGRIAKSFVLGLGMACAVAWAAHAFRFDPAVALWGLPFAGIVLACLRPSRPNDTPEPRSLLPWTLLAAWVVVVAVLVGSLGAPLMTDTDSPDHIATVRRIADTRVVLPTDAFFVDAGANGADPRKGLYHAWVALVVRAAHVDPVDAWRWLPALLIPVFLLAVASLTLVLTRSRSAALVAAVLFPLLYGGGLGGTELRETVYSTRVGEIAALLATTALVRFVERGGRRRLALWIALAWTALAIHVWYALWFAIACGVYALGVLLVRRNREVTRRFALAFGGLAAPALPYLLFRAGQSYGPQNVIHTEPQGLFFLADRLFTVDPQALWSWNGLGLVLVLAAAPWFWSRRHDSTGAIYLALVPWTVIGVVMNPLLLPLAHAKLGYLVSRLVWIVPVVPGLATIVVALGKTAVRGAGRRRAAAAAALAVIGLWLLPHLAQAVSLVTERPALLAQERQRGPEPWRDVLDWLKEDGAGLDVLVSDPATCYSIPAYTGRHVSAFLDQHSSPNDPRGLERILDARDILSPFVDERRTLELLRKWRIDGVVVNQRFTEPITFDYWSVEPALYGATRAKFTRHPEWFTPVFEAPGAYVYALTAAAKNGPLPAARAVPRPGSPGWPAAGSAREAHEDPLIPRLAQLGTVTDRPVYAPGDTIRLVTWWSWAGGAPLPPGSYTVFVRLDGAEPRGVLYADAWQKPYRKVLEKLSGKKWRIRASHRPLNGVLSPDQWQPQEIVEDHSILVLPPDMAPGPYEVHVRMLRTPHYPNTHLRDYLSDDDAMNGPLVGRVVIALPGAVEASR